MSPPTSLAVCICTHRRPSELGRLLRRLQQESADLAGTVDVGVVVVDDATERSAQLVVDAFAGAFPLGIRYTNTASGNISTARNRAVEGGIAVGSLLAFIDDDCLPDRGWLRELVALQQHTGCDLVSGCCRDEAPAAAPKWFVDGPFLAGPLDIADGAAMEVGAMKNTLATAEFLTRTGVRFDVSLGVAGGEDVMWFRQAQAAGASLRYAANAVVREMTPIGRTSMRYLLRRALWYGNTESVTCIRSGTYGRSRMLMSGAKRTLGATARPFTRLVRRQTPQWRYATTDLLRGVGRMLGAMGVVIRHH
ncbi:MAG TPA: glycosyltransferase [Ilumatobacteraceae bacterium]|nr:glycosyltransferase [Ilumatobacteraceae bacterium]